MQHEPNAKTMLAQALGVEMEGLCKLVLTIDNRRFPVVEATYRVRDADKLAERVRLLELICEPVDARTPPSSADMKAMLAANNAALLERSRGAAMSRDAVMRSPLSPYTPAEDQALILVGDCYGWASGELLRFVDFLHARHGLPPAPRFADFLRELAAQGGNTPAVSQGQESSYVG